MRQDLKSAAARMRGRGVAAAGWLALFAASLAVFALAAKSATVGLAPGFSETFLIAGLLPRGVFALLGGAALGLAGALLQQALRNPAADPSTLGIGAGAQLALGIATLLAPALLAGAKVLVAFAGGAAALALVLILSRRRNYDPVTMILCGLVVSLVASSLSATLILAGGDYMMSLYLWGGGALDQSGWRSDAAIGLMLGVAAPAVFLMRRPLAILSLSDESARGVGVATGAIRLAAAVLATVLATGVIASVGIVGFVGLAAANLARLSGARSASARLVAAPLIGAVLLFATDAAVLALQQLAGTTIPTGAVTALLGGPVLLWLLPRLPHRSVSTLPAPARRIRAVSLGLAALAAATAAATLVSLYLAPDGRAFLSSADLAETLMPLRWPRLVSGAAAGALLGAAGTILQRVTANPIASPEVLGISTGAGLGLAALLVIDPLAGSGPTFAAAAGGSLAALAAILAFAHAARLGPERLILGGIAVASLAGAGVTLVLSRGGPEATRLLDWMSGSTLRVTPGVAVAEALLAIVLVPLALFGHRWLAILQLGEATAIGLGISPQRAGGLLVALAAVATAAATLAVGPLSFVGLMAPHLARTVGFSRPRDQLAASALVGALLMIVTDTAARSLAFPYQLPTGLVAALVGGAYLVALVRRKAPAG
ncbi:Fe(3+)-hydroxamate ABC transporter permease FhuB [Jiella sonneratiae]|uniref:Fe(3+)-hydroxamate ABC transporter permease FhuB n=1 Tax=Jiella sonneratiae TaxID=2816856 RepID=A0ABS3J9Q9_9HYPH|nr:Fe(3+)-hydroxamate ABC transporter permease FhuB [Jiella sonneratiae]MBO0905857.1 Fe(3+)-hydroxamate ABC transporter permease FhuB [Jiella sonneratiae]